MQISNQEQAEFPDKYKWMADNMMHTTMQVPTHLEILAAMLVMEKEDPMALVEMLKEIKELDK